VRSSESWLTFVFRINSAPALGHCCVMDTSPRVFISYHREDTEADAGRLSDTLRRRLGDDRIFTDVTGIEFGANWERVIERTLQGAVAVLVVAGPRWKATEAIIYELEAAIDAGIAIMPIVVRRANWVSLTTELPSKLHELRKFNATALNHSTWNRDVEPLALLLERMLADPGRAKAICKAPDPAALLSSRMNRHNIHWLLIHAADLAECLDDPSVLAEAQQAATGYAPSPSLENPNPVPPHLIYLLGNARSRLMTEELGRDLLSRGEYAARLLGDTALEQEIHDKWHDFGEAKSEWSRTRGDTDENPREYQREAEEADEMATSRLRAMLPGLTRDRQVQETLFKLVESEVVKILEQDRVNDYWEYSILKHFSRCPDKRFEIRDRDQAKVQKMLNAFKPNKSML
jgi:TIR domain-containing protein